MPFVDLSVRADLENPHALREHLGALLEFGYGVVVTDARVAAGERNVGAALRSGLAPVPDDVLAAVAADARASGARPRLDRASRLTLVFAEPAELQEVLAKHDELVRRYDVLALEPTSERAFASACANRRADVLAVDLGARPAFRARAPALRAACARGACVEISYNPALSLDPARRRNFFANAAQLARLVGPGAGGGAGAGADASAGGGVVIAGGSRAAAELRGPYDVANLATLFGMKDEQTRAAMSTRAVALLTRAAAKRRIERGER